MTEPADREPEEVLVWNGMVERQTESEPPPDGDAADPDEQRDERAAP